MKLRSGTQVVQTCGIIAQNPKTFKPIAEHNASSPFLMLPQELKNRIYHFVCGGQMVHILQNDSNHCHAHGDDTARLSHSICIERIAEEQIQKDFDSADPDTIGWNVAAVKSRHGICHEPPLKRKKGRKHNQLSLTLLRSCRQIYLEANMVHYTNNTFAIGCNEVLERFVKTRFQNKQHIAIRSLYLEINVIHASSINAWSNSINKAVLKRLKSVRFLYLKLEQLYCTCSIESCGYDGSYMTDRQRRMFKKLSKLPLRDATLVIDDSVFWESIEFDEGSRVYSEVEQLYRWTMKQKQEFSKEVRDALLERGEEVKQGKQVGTLGGL